MRLSTGTAIFVFLLAYFTLQAGETKPSAETGEKIDSVLETTAAIWEAKAASVSNYSATVHFMLWREEVKQNEECTANTWFRDPLYRVDLCDKDGLWLRMLITSERTIKFAHQLLVDPYETFTLAGLSVPDGTQIGNHITNTYYDYKSEMPAME